MRPWGESIQKQWRFKHYNLLIQFQAAKTTHWGGGACFNQQKKKENGWIKMKKEKSTPKQREDRIKIKQTWLYRLEPVGTSLPHWEQFPQQGGVRQSPGPGVYTMSDRCSESPFLLRCPIRRRKQPSCTSSCPIATAGTQLNASHTSAQEKQ